jgi:hypothetical protein
VLVTQKGLKIWYSCILILILNVLYIHVTVSSHSSVLRKLKEILVFNKVQ